MLGKLLKYEWRGLRFPFLILLIVLASTTLLTCGVILTINPMYDESLAWYSVMALMLSIFLYYFGIIGCTIGTSLIVVVRFYKTCYTDQGYLTHTLPVTAGQLLNAKLIAAVAADILMVLSIALSLFLIVQVGLHHFLSFAPGYTYEEMMRELSQEFSYVFGDFEESFGISFGLFIVYMVVYSVIAMIANIVTIFGCVSLGQLFTKHRIIGAIIAYFGVQFILQIAGYFTSLPMYTKMLITNYDSDLTFFGLMSPTLNLTLLAVTVLAVAMYFINLHMMTKRLNLE